MRSGRKPLFTVLEGTELQLPSKLNTHRVRSRLIAAGSTKLGDALRERRGRIFATTLVGIVSTSDAQVQILPKTTGSVDLAKSVTLLRNMLRFERRLRAEVRSSQVEARTGTVLDIIAAAVARRTLDNLKDGVPRRYFPASDEMETVKGRIDLNYLARRGPAAGFRVLVHHAPLQNDNHLSQLIKAVLQRLHTECRNVGTRSLLALCLEPLGAVRNVELTQRLVDQARLTPFETHWSWFLEITALMLAGRTPDPLKTGEASGFSFVFSLHHLFEQAVRSRLVHAMPAGHRLKSTKSIGYLIENANDGTKTLRLEPDFLVEKGANLVVVGDAKWKDVSRKGMAREDLYQLTSYIMRSGTSVGFLCYPSSPEARCTVRRYTFQETAKCLYQVEIDPQLLCSPIEADISTVQNALRDAITEMSLAAT